MAKKIKDIVLPRCLPWQTNSQGELCLTCLRNSGELIGKTAQSSLIVPAITNIGTCENYVGDLKELL